MISFYVFVSLYILLALLHVPLIYDYIVGHLCAYHKIEYSTGPLANLIRSKFNLSGIAKGMFVLAFVIVVLFCVFSLASSGTQISVLDLFKTFISEFMDGVIYVLGTFALYAGFLRLASK